VGEVQRELQHAVRSVIAALRASLDDEVATGLSVVIILRGPFVYSLGPEEAGEFVRGGHPRDGQGRSSNPTGTMKGVGFDPPIKVKPVDRAFRDSRAIAHEVDDAGDPPSARAR